MLGLLHLLCQLPNHAEYSGSHLNTKVKQHQAGLVPGWETTWKTPVLLTFLQAGACNETPNGSMRGADAGPSWPLMSPPL